MSNQTASNSTFSATCRNCGGRVSRPVSFCPHCGANAMLAFPNAKSWAGNERAEPQLGDSIRPPRPVPLFMPAGAAAHVGGGSSAGAATYGNARQWGLKTGTGVTLLVFAVLVGGSIVLSQQSDKTEQHSRDVLMHTAVGSVAPGAGDHAQATPPATQNTPAPQVLAMTAPAPAPQPTVTPRASQPAPAAPKASTQAPVAAAPAPVPAAPSQAATAPAPTSPAPATAAPAQAARAQSQPAPVPHPPTYANTRARTPSPPVPSPRESHQAQRREAAPHELAAAWTSLQKNDLKGAQGALDRALADDPNNSEAFMLRQDLLSREQSRDDALIAARGCAAQHQWRCAWHNAGKALAIDSSSAEAKAMVQRSIVDSGAMELPAGPGPDMPDGPVMPPGYH
jgi:hypothetical protein